MGYTAPWEIGPGLPAICPSAFVTVPPMAAQTPAATPAVPNADGEAHAVSIDDRMDARGDDDDDGGGGDRCHSGDDSDSGVAPARNPRLGHDHDIEMNDINRRDNNEMDKDHDGGANSDDGGDDDGDRSDDGGDVAAMRTMDDTGDAARRELPPRGGGGLPAAQTPPNITPPPPRPAYLSSTALAQRVRNAQVKFKLRGAAGYSAAELRNYISISLVHPVSGTLRSAPSAHRVTAPYLAALLRLRGYAVYDGDLERSLIWLESAGTPKTLPPPSDDLRRYLARAVLVDDTPGQVAPSAPFGNDDDDDCSSEDSDEFSAVMKKYSRRSGNSARSARSGHGRGHGRGRNCGGGGGGRARSRSRDDGRS